MYLTASPEMFSRLAAGVVALLLTRTVWRRRDIPGALPFVGMLLAAAWWAMFSGLEYATQDVSGRILWSKLEYPGIAALAPCWLLFALEFSQSTQTFRRISSSAWLFLIPVIVVGLVFTNERHGLIWPAIDPVQEPFGWNVRFDHGPAFWVFWIYSYALLLAGTLALIFASTHFPALYRYQTTGILVGVAIPWLFNLIYVLGLNPISLGDWTPVAFILSGAVFTFSAFRFHLFDIVPVAQDAVMESFSEGVIVLDPYNRIVYMNSPARSLLNAQSLTGQPAEQVFQAYPELYDAWQQNKPSAEITLTASPTRVFEMHTSTLTRPLGRSAGHTIILRDITEQKAQEEQRYLQSVAIESAANGIVITNRDGSIIWVNKAFSQITGYPLEEAYGKNPSILKSGSMDLPFYENLWYTILEGEVWRGELINRRKDGSIYTEEQTIVPVRDTAGKITYFIGFKQDISARKKLEQTQDMLMKSLVHDLRNPLNSILLAIEVFGILPEPVPLPEAVEHMIKIGRDSAQRMMGMINAILDISRLESGEIPLVRERVVLAEMVERACQQQSSLASYGEVILLNDVPYDLPPVQADPILLSRILQNLLDNAIKFSPNNGQVEVSACWDTEQTAVVVAIKNYGPEIDPALFPRMFDKYVSGNTSRRGSGLGLAFCRLAVEAHGGKIWVESSKKETIFFFTLPRP